MFKRAKFLKLVKQVIILTIEELMVKLVIKQVIRQVTRLVARLVVRLVVKQAIIMVELLPR